MIFRGTGVWAATSADCAFGGYAHYGGAWVNNTIIGPGISACPHCSAFESDREAQYGPTNPSTVHNNLTVGCGQQMTYNTGANTSYAPPNTPPYSENSGNNSSDLPSNYATSTFNSAAGLYGSIANLTAIPFPGGNSMCCGPGNHGSCVNLNPNAVFVHPNIGAAYSTLEDWRLCTIALCGQASPVIGVGTTFSYATNAVAPLILTPGNDIFGQSRVRSGLPSIDLGAAQATSGPAPPLVPGGGFRLFH